MIKIIKNKINMNNKLKGKKEEYIIALEENINCLIKIKTILLKHCL